MIYKRAWAEINLSHLKHNINVVQANLQKNTQLMGIVKADAYGHGAVPVARTLLDSGVKRLGVAICEEGVELRQNAIMGGILVMGYTPEQLLHEVVCNNLTQTVFSLSGAQFLAREAARANTRAKIHIKIDTGMSRLGFLPCEKSVSEILEIAQIPEIELEGIYTHLATSDELDTGFMHEQLSRFNWIVNELSQKGLQIPLRHISNSGAFSHITTGETSFDGFFQDFVRVGIMLYGYPPSAEMIETCAPLGLLPVMRLMSRVGMVKELDANVGISYGHLYKTQRKSTIAVLPIGYADGYPRRLSHGGKVKIGEKFAPIAGAICMDQCMVDITDLPCVNPGDVVTMMGEPGICADNLAEIVGTISYEILCGIGKRVPRIYTV